MASLEMRPTSKWWYGRYRQRDRIQVTNLGILIRGERPPSLDKLGSPEFEQSRGEAKAKLLTLAHDMISQKAVENLAQAVHEARTGQRVGSLGVQDLISKWEQIPRKHAPAQRYAQQCRAVLKRFQEFVRDHHPSTKCLHEVSRQLAQEFMAAEGARGVTAKTWNDTFKLLRATFKHLSYDAGLSTNPFSAMVTKDTETVFREPFRPEELKAVLDAAVSDDFIRPIIITAACTAMRRGDCCQLKWKDVDLKDGFITVKTSKTRQTVDIPIFPMLYQEIQARVANGSEYVFPEQADTYKANPDQLTRRLRQVLATAGFRDAGMVGAKLKELTPETAQTIRTRAAAWFAKQPVSGRLTRMQAVLESYLAGSCVGDIAVKTGISKGSVSDYLNAVEESLGCTIIRGKVRKVLPQAEHRGAVHQHREHGLRRASLRDFHSFRTTWITLALSSNIPLDLVRKVTGHQTVEVVMKHYFRPHREQLKKALKDQMPALLTDGAASSAEDVAAILNTATENNWERVITRAICALKGSSK